MQTEINWMPPTLHTALQQGLSLPLVTQNPLNNSNKLKYKCGCGCFAWSFQMFDVRPVNGVAAQFICCGCYSTLERELADITGNGAPQNIKQFRAQFATLHNAPAELQTLLYGA